MSEVTKAPVRPVHDDTALVYASMALRRPGSAIGPRAQRTITKIAQATREVLLTRGYAGTTVDEIAQIADVSRASFYSYFPSKREVLLALGEQTARAGLAAIDHLGAMSNSRAKLGVFVAGFFEYLDVHGGFAFAWTQAAHEDEELRIAGMKRHLTICRRLGQRLGGGEGRTDHQNEMLGLVALSTLERSWNFADLYSDTIDRDEVIAHTANALWGLSR